MNIYVTEKQFRQMLSESLLMEGFSRYLYHFCTLGALKSMLATNAFIFSSSINTERDKTINRGYRFFMSFTRQHTSNVGYASWINGNTDSSTQMLSCRITVNGETLGNYFKGGPVNYHFKENPHNKQQKEMGSDAATLVQIRQSEDRLFSNEPYVTGISKFIERVDILLKRKENGKFYQKALNTVQSILKYEEYKGRIFVFDNVRDFNMPKNDNFINDEILGSVSDSLRDSLMDRNALSRNYIKVNSTVSRGRPQVDTLKDWQLTAIANTLAAVQAMKNQWGDDVTGMIDYVFSGRENMVGATTLSKEKNGVFREYRKFLKAGERPTLSRFVTSVYRSLSNNFKGDFRILYATMQNLLIDCSNAYGGRGIQSIIPYLLKYEKTA